MYPSPVSFNPITIGINSGDNNMRAIAEDTMSEARLKNLYIFFSCFCYAKIVSFRMNSK